MDWYDEKIMKKMLAKRTVTENGCWEWTGALFNDGYGAIYYVDKVWKVHRLILFITDWKKYKDNLYVCHSCDNKKCFNPAHLWFGNQGDNMTDASVKGRLGIQEREKYPCGHAFTSENTFNRKDGARLCKTCKKERNKEWMRRQYGQRV